MEFCLPIVSMLAVTIWAMWYTGGGLLPIALCVWGDAITNCDISIALTWGSFTMVLVIVIISLIQGFTLDECERTLMSGFKSILPSLVIIILAWSLGTICDKLETGAHVIKATEGWMSPFWLPFIIFILSSLISFATGTSWGTMAIVSPVALTLGYKLGDLPLLTITSGATFSGSVSVFDDHCSPVSDSTIMASTYSQAPS